jgi:sarcosine oxidase subunit alpha
VPGAPPRHARSAGAANGTFALAASLAEGYRAGAGAAEAAGYPPPPSPFEEKILENQIVIYPLWDVLTPATQRAKRFVDFQNDVTAADIALAAREGYAAVEHLKRYTTLGMGTDQGKLSNVNGLAILAGLLQAQLPEVGTTTFRPPYTAVTLGAIAGTETGAAFDPVRLTPLHAWHERAGARFVPAGLWKRAQFYPRPGESDLDCTHREALAVRRAAGIVDVSTLGRIDVQGRDAAAFLDRVYANGIGTLPAGRCRYGLMLREDGMVFDDGTVARLGERHYLLTTTTANAARVMSWLEYWLQVQWPQLEVWLASVTEQWAGVALAGPRARAVLAALADADVGDGALPFMGWREARVAGIPARLFRISFSGELGYEINVPADHATALWEALLEAGAPHGIAPYGTEAMGVLRIEKGHVAGMELDGRTTPDDLGLARLVAAHKDCLGKRSLRRPGLADPARRQLVGLTPVDGASAIPRGAQLVADPRRAAPNPILGHVTSTCHSPALGHPIALALLSGGRARHGEVLHACAPLADARVAVRVTGPVFYDADGKRLRG